MVVVAVGMEVVGEAGMAEEAVEDMGEAAAFMEVVEGAVPAVLQEAGVAVAPPAAKQQRAIAEAHRVVADRASPHDIPSRGRPTEARPGQWGVEVLAQWEAVRFWRIMVRTDPHSKAVLAPWQINDSPAATIKDLAITASMGMAGSAMEDLEVSVCWHWVTD